MEQINKVYQNESNEVRQTTRRLLDVVEAAFGHLPQFPHVRSRMLALMGKNGLEGRMNGTDFKTGTEYGHGTNQR